MRVHQCSVHEDETNKRSSLVRLLLCLGEKMKKGYHFQDECRREMLVHRRMLISDYTLSPEIVSQCRTEMVQYCLSLFLQGASDTIDQRGDRMIHCLLKAARQKKNFSAECLSNIKSLIRATDPDNGIRADPLLETTCQPVIDTLCSRIQAGDSNVIMCLLDNLKNSHMIEECEDRLMEVAYFMVRDCRLTSELMRTCRADLAYLCKLPNSWSMEEELNDVKVRMYLGCLYRQRFENNCRTEFK